MAAEVFIDAQVPYLDDNTQLLRVTRALHDGGYLPSFAYTKLGDKSGYVAKVPVLFDGKHSFQNPANPTDFRPYAVYAAANPHKGIAVWAPKTQNPDLLLCPLDVDSGTYGDTFQRCLASVLFNPVPCRVGSKGVGMFASLPVEFLDPDSEPRKLLAAYQKSKGTAAGQGGRQRKLSDGHYLSSIPHIVECFGLKASQHFLIPPSFYYYDSAREDGPHRAGTYTWVKFPSVNPAKAAECLSLEDTPLEDLPRLDAWRLREIVMHGTTPVEKLSAIQTFILHEPWSGPGDGEWRSAKHNAIHAYVGDQFDHEYVARRIEEIIRDQFGIYADDLGTAGDWDFEQEAKDTLKSIAGSAKAFEKKGGAKVSKAKASRKLPDDREAADWLMDEFPPDDVRIFDGMHRVWTEGQWWALDETDLNQHLYRHQGHLGHSSIQSAIKLWMAQNTQDAPASSPNTILFQNGMYDVTLGHLREPTREDYNPYMMQTEWKADAKAPIWERHLRVMTKPPITAVPDYTDEQIEQDQIKAMEAVEAFIGYCMVRNYDYEKVLFLIGPEGCGKGTISKVMKLLFPENSMSKVGLTEMGDDGYRDQMVGKLVNFGGEIARKQHMADAALNLITSHEEVPVWRMHVSRTMVRLMTRLIFDGNSLPSMSGSAGGFGRRAIIIQCSKPDNRVTLPTSRYLRQFSDELPGIAARLVAAYSRLKARGDADEEPFILPSYAQEQIDEVKRMANPVNMWLQDHVEESAIPFPNDMLYEHYKEWSERYDSSRPLGVVVWGQRMAEMGHASLIRRMPLKNGKTGSMRVRMLRLIDGERFAQLQAVKGSY